MKIPMYYFILFPFSVVQWCRQVLHLYRTVTGEIRINPSIHIINIGSLTCVCVCVCSCLYIQLCQIHVSMLMATVFTSVLGLIVSCFMDWTFVFRYFKMLHILLQTLSPSDRRTVCFCESKFSVTFYSIRIVIITWTRYHTLSSLFVRLMHKILIKLLNC